MAGMGTLRSDRLPVTGGPLTQAQFAATIAALLGLETEFRRANPRAAASVFVERP